MSFLFLNNNKWTFFVFSVSNVKYLIFYTYDTTATELSRLNVRIYLKGKKYFRFGMKDRYVNKWKEELGHVSGTE